jgi:uncharacterized membrane protein YphA (DoxX/SURF4 family)
LTVLRRVGPILLVVLRLAVGATLLWAGLSKIPEPGLFSQTVRAYEVLPLAWVNPFAVVMPWVEVLAGACLVVGFWTRSSAVVSLLLLLSFGIALGINIHRGVDLSCGCFALDGTKGSLTEALVRDIVLIAFSVTLALVHRLPFSLDALLARPRAQPSAEPARAHE